MPFPFFIERTKNIPLKILFYPCIIIIIIIINPPHLLDMDTQQPVGPPNTELYIRAESPGKSLCDN